MQAVPGGANYWDLGLQEGHVRLWLYSETPSGDVEETTVTPPLPEDIMDELEELLGDGQATVTIGKDIKTSQNFETAGSSCFIKLTCNQDLKTVLKTREIAQSLAIGFAEQGYEQARYALDRMMGRDVPEPAPLEVVSDAPKAQVPAAETKNKAAPRKTKRPVLRNKPSFKR